MNVMTPTLVHPGRAQTASGCLGLAAARAAATAAATATATATAAATAAVTATAATAVTGGPAGEEDLMTRRQVAVLFRVTSAVVATWARRGRLPEVRNEDGRPRYRRGDVEQLFRSDVARRLR
jgi:MerR HTH family regulatory protein